MLVFLQFKMNLYGEYVLHGKMLQRFEKHYTKRQLGQQGTSQFDLSADYLILSYVKTKRICS